MIDDQLIKEAASVGKLLGMIQRGAATRVGRIRTITKKIPPSGGGMAMPAVQKLLRKVHTADLPALREFYSGALQGRPSVLDAVSTVGRKTVPPTYRGIMDEFLRFLGLRKPLSGFSSVQRLRGGLARAIPDSISAVSEGASAMHVPHTAGARAMRELSRGLDL